jgi:hypothetical protein
MSMPGVNPRPLLPRSDRVAIPVVRAHDLYAEYSTARRTVDGRWVAVGSVRDERSSHALPAWILVGTGDTEEIAIDELRSRLEEEEERLARLHII